MVHVDAVHLELECRAQTASAKKERVLFLRVRSSSGCGDARVLLHDTAAQRPFNVSLHAHLRKSPFFIQNPTRLTA